MTAKINLVKFTALLCLFVFITNSTLHAQGFLRAIGPQIVNEKGQEVLLRGMGLGGWMLQEGYMLKLKGDGQQHVIMQKIEALIGRGKTREFYSRWVANHVRKIDVDSMKAWGFNSLRLPMHYNLFTLPVESEVEAGKNTWLTSGFALTDSLLKWCKANKMYLILDLHAAPGGQGNDVNISDRDTTKPSLWDSEANQQKTVALWKMLATRYAAEPWIGGYDILNEPNYGFTEPEKDRNGLNEQKNKPLKKLYQEITAAIREVDKKHLIIIEGNGWGNNYNGLLPPWDNNMVLSFHKYWNFNDAESIAKIVALRRAFNVPVWLGETGENSNVWYTQAIRLLEKNNIGWAWWPLKKIGNNNPLEIKAPKGYDLLLQYWAGKGEKPDSLSAYKTLMQLADNARLENNVYHKDVIDAMIRQPFSDNVLPFKNHIITNGAVVNAVDYDLGKNGFAYYDKDTADYWISNKPGVGNSGHTYRNDGVDIMADSAQQNRYFITGIETGEWLQYTLTIAKAGNYDVEFIAASDSANAAMEISLEPSGLIKQVNIAATGAGHWQTISVKNVALPPGKCTLKITAKTGGYQLQSLKFILHN